MWKYRSIIYLIFFWNIYCTSKHVCMVLKNLLNWGKSLNDLRICLVFVCISVYSFLFIISICRYLHSVMFLHLCSLVTSLFLCLIWDRTHPESASVLFLGFWYLHWTVFTSRFLEFLLYFDSCLFVWFLSFCFLESRYLFSCWVFVHHYWYSLWPLPHVVSRLLVC